MTRGAAGRTGSDGLGLNMTALAAADLGSARVLVMDSQASEGDLAVAVLEGHGYDVVQLSRDEDLTTALRERAIDVVLLEAGTRGPDGEDALAALRKDRRLADVPVLSLGGARNGEAHGAPQPSGVDDVVARPLEPTDLLDRVSAALRVRRSLLGMEIAHEVVASLANEIIAPNTDIRLHTERLGTYAVELGRRVGLCASELQAISYGTLLHDLGKLGISDAILQKPGPLTDEEIQAVRRHVEIGERIAAPLLGSDRFRPILRHHHERWDGRGYPDGLAGEAIPLGARIIGIVDSFDAMTQFRVYRSAISVPDAVAELQRERGSQFDAQLVDAFIGVLEWDGLI
jgi:putative two-component system response regulator